MNLLIDWVTQIILFLLLAMIIELILPNSSMKKYLNMVVGLLLILIFLQPLFQLFHVDIEEIIRSTSPTLDTTFEEENMKNSIELKKNEIQASQDAYVVEEMAVQMKKQVEEGLSEDYGVSIIDITFQFKEEENINLEELETVNVLLSKKEMKTDGEVQEVVIDVNQPETEDNSSPETEKIKKYLYESWQLKNQNLTILWEGGV